MSRLKFEAQIEDLRSQWEDLTRQIQALPQGAVRLELKKRRNKVMAQANNVRTSWIGWELQQPEPQHVPRVSFEEMRIRNRAPETTEENEDPWTH